MRFIKAKKKILKSLLGAAGVAFLFGSLNLIAIDNFAYAAEKQKLEVKAEDKVSAEKLSKKALKKAAKKAKQKKASVSKAKDQKAAPVEQAPAPKPIPQSITVSVAGDCTMGSYLEKGQVFDPEYREIGSYEDYYQKFGPTYFFKNVQEVFAKDDFTWINLEGPLSYTAPVEEKTYPIRCHPEEVNTLKAGSVEVCNLANNHIWDCGWEGLNSTKNILKANEIGFSGEGHTYIANKNGIKIAFLGYVTFAANAELFDMIKKDIADARSQGTDVVMVQFHGGEERVYEPDEEQKYVFRYAIDNGADVVVGAHPHVIRGIEMYKGKPICYSLGNFSFGANWNPVDKDTFIYQATFTRTPDNKVALSEQKIIPCRISSVTTRNDFCPTILTGQEAENVFVRLREYSKKFPVSGLSQ